MSDDKRKVSTDALETLGNIIGPEEKRDAIHLAVIPIQAKSCFSPGDHASSEGTRIPPFVGIVDPFLTQRILPGEWFWLVIYPRQITSLRHVWSHPAFPEEIAESYPKFRSTKEESELWLKGWLHNADCGGLSYEGLLNLARTGSAHGPDDDYYGNSWRLDGEYLYSYGRDAGGEIPSEVWDHVENVIGKKTIGRPTYFSCSC